MFIKRFQSVAQYYCWSEDEQLFRLEHCLTDNAQYVLMDMPVANSVAEFLRTLRSRFNLIANTEQHRAELSRLRKGNRSVQELYLEVRRLVNKAFPGAWTVLTEVYARDAFLNALDEPELRKKILLSVPSPETLAAAYDLAVRALAYDEAEDNRSAVTGSGRNYGRNGQPRAHVLQTASTASPLATAASNQPSSELSDLR